MGTKQCNHCGVDEGAVHRKECLTNRCSCASCTTTRESSKFTQEQALLLTGPAPVLPLDDAARKALPIFTFLTEYFPDVIVELTRLCVAGNIQHNPELAPNDIMWAIEKSTDHMNTAFRHQFDRGTGTHYDKDEQPHLVKAIWRLCAQRQTDIWAERKAAARAKVAAELPA